jgi:hypothetical protein
MQQVDTPKILKSSTPSEIRIIPEQKLTSLMSDSCRSLISENKNKTNRSDSRGKEDSSSTGM